MKLKTNNGELYFNPQLISHLHLSADHSLLTLHFVNGTPFGLSTETDVDDTSIAEFLGKFTEEHSGFVAIGNEVVNLRSALWVVIPDEGPVQVRSGDNRTRSLDDADRERIRKMLAE